MMETTRFTLATSMTLRTDARKMKTIKEIYKQKTNKNKKVKNKRLKNEKKKQEREREGDKN